MPIYEFECSHCGKITEEIMKVEDSDVDRIWCRGCGGVTDKIVSSFKIGTRSLETTGRTGYDDDDLTLGKLIDNDGLPYEYKEKLRKQNERAKGIKKYTKGLKERAKKYKFDPFAEE